MSESRKPDLKTLERWRDDPLAFMQALIDPATGLPIKLTPWQVERLKDALARDLRSKLS